TALLRLGRKGPRRAAGEGPGGTDDEGPGRRRGKVTVQYDLKELRKRLNLEKGILEQLTRLYDCQEEEIPKLEIDVDELLDMESDDARQTRKKGKQQLCGSMRPPEEGANSPLHLILPLSTQPHVYNVTPSHARANMSHLQHAPRGCLGVSKQLPDL
uniref:Protein phosphatase 1 regulatory subunit 14 n=1 Tax=Piliocolobus tephrosceles TaxID=591936 RepID=A0A8C9LZ73_9PRIM